MRFTMTFFNRFRLITFDLRDTLLRFRNTPGKRFKELAATHGINYSDEKSIEDAFSGAWKRLRGEHPNFGLGSGIPLKKWWDKLMFETFRSQLTGPDDPRIEKLSSDVEEVLTSPVQWANCPGCPRILEYFQDNNIRMGVVSNFDTRLDKLIDRMGLREYFSFVLASYREGAEKPDRRIFNRALFLSRLPGITAKDALHIGREPAADYQGAREAGWSALLVTDWTPDRILARYPNVSKNHIFKSLDELRQKFSQGALNL